MEDFFLLNRCARDIILAQGDEVIGDLAGFVAPGLCNILSDCAMRANSIHSMHDALSRFSLLCSMVDYSVGVKTAIDTPHDKNIVRTLAA